MWCRKKCWSKRKFHRDMCVYIKIIEKLMGEK